MLYELFQLAIGNLGRARARLVMTSGGVLVGTTAVILLIALTVGLQQAAEAGIGSSASLTEIQVYPNYGREANDNIPQLDPAAVRAFWQIPGVAAVIPMVHLQAGELQVDDYSGYVYPVAGIDPNLLPYMGLQAQVGELSLQPGQIIAGARAGDNFYDPESSDEVWQPVIVNLLETPPTLLLYQHSSDGAGGTRKINLTITGQLAEGNNFDYGLLMPIQEVLSLNEWITGQEVDPETFRYDEIIVRATSRETANPVSEAIRELGYATGGIGDYLNQLNNFFGTMRLMLGGVGGVALLVAAFGVANTMMMAILERTREIGLMKAIGATNRDVLTVFLIESGLVGLFGGLAGVGLSYLLQNLINQAVSNLSTSTEGGGGFFLPVDPSQIGGNLVVIPPELALFAVALAVLVGVGAGFYPALRAAQLPPVIALKQE